MEIISREAAMAKGLKRYYTGTPCIHGHNAERFTSQMRCVVCEVNDRVTYRKTQKFKEVKFNKYGITSKEVEEMVNSQQGRCAICRLPFSGQGRERHAPNIDHCHTTGEVRGMLCGHCNKRLSMYHDSIEELQHTIDYLKIFKEQT